MFHIANNNYSSFSILIHRLFELQIVNGQKYAEDFELQITRTVRDHNTRGNIYDCNGEALAYNELVYTVTMVIMYIP
ncbi:hypothetical protein [Petralouisia muris]|uniref:hypothetical protein n=1 Tax=Petralouisia muris TaxID=3032872 RepID=UPI0026AD9A68